MEAAVYVYMNESFGRAERTEQNPVNNDNSVVVEDFGPVSHYVQ